ncbi:MAG: ornithine cyclodeaminase family protein [Acidobacteria bacterium]|nr:ornithine cyclodeaminase family protein [Acidobacteriota bacterium]
MVHIDEATVRQLLPMSKAIDLLARAFRDLAAGEAQSQPRRRLTLPTGAVLHQMAGAHGAYFGTKIYSTHPQHGAWFVFLLYDAETAIPLALLDANWLGQIRTGAASGLATRWLARPEARTVAVLGSGFQAASQLEAVLAVRPIRAISVWSRSQDKAQAFARNYPNAAAMPTVEAALVDADIVVTATTAKEPLFPAELIRPGTHINAVGSNSPLRRELPAELIHRADRIVVDSVEQAQIEAGDLLLSLAPDEWSRVVPLAGEPQRESPEAITIFKSVGLGLEDVAVGGWVYEQALAQGKVTPLPLFAAG